MMLSDTGLEVPLPGFKFITAAIKAKSGLPLRSGLARLAAWGWMFKAFTQRDWAIFTQTYGQPLRLGKYGAGASENDKETLFRAVANIAGDCAAIVPASMEIEFVETGSVGASADMYLKRVDHLDQQISKAVLGQTATTDAVTGGLGSGKEHRQVQEDIERADARALAAILNRDLIRPWMQLEFGDLPAYPRLRIAREEPEDTKALAETAEAGVRMGLRISAKKTRDRLGLDEPEDDEDVLSAPEPEKPPETAPEGGAAGTGTDPSGRGSKIKRVSGVFKRGEAPAGRTTALQAEGLSAARKTASSETAPPPEVLADRMEIEAAPALSDMLARIEVMVEAAQSMPELREMLMAAFPGLDAGTLADVLALGLLAAESAASAAVEAGA